MTERYTLEMAKPAIERWIYEAHMCASYEYGFAAMSTILPVIFTVVENIYRYERLFIGTTQTIAAHLSEYRWLVPPNQRIEKYISDRGSLISDIEVILDLLELRLGELSLPGALAGDMLTVHMTNTWAEAKGPWHEKFPDDYVIAVEDFVLAVKAITNELIEKHPHAELRLKLANRHIIQS